MTFETAKKLKDAGFPQTGENMVSHLSMKEKFNASIMGESLGYVCIPTLSELIEACKNELDEIIIYITYNLTEVQGINPTYGYDLSVEGSTPEEAVANLWLELNKK